MQIKELKLTGGGKLVCWLRDIQESMPQVLTRPMVLVVPGGGYEHVSAREADPAALQFAAAGYHTAILYYGVGEKARDYLPLRQISQALGLLRAHAAEWGIQPDKIAVCGFSAGGHLALSSAVLDLPQPDQAAAQNRPNALILAYPVISAGLFAHRGSFVQLAGSEDLEAHQCFSLEKAVHPGMPPVFVWHTMNDETVPVQNTLLLLDALQKVKVPCEAHLFAEGIHGASICTAEVNTPLPRAANWVKLALDWLSDRFAYYV